MRESGDGPADDRTIAAAATALRLIRERREALAELALALGNVYGPVGQEAATAAVIDEWYRDHGIESSLIELAPGRANVVARLRGDGKGVGRSLLFNAHLDTEASGPDFTNLMQVADPNVVGAWREGDRLFGHTVINDRHGHALFMLAAQALLEADVRLSADVVLTSVAGETGQAAVDEYQGLAYEGKGFGSTHLVEHGVTADYAIVAETSGFALCWYHCGANYYKITIRGRNIYTPRLVRPERLSDHPNAIVKAAEVVRAVEAWAIAYTALKAGPTVCGEVAPNAQVGAVRGGIPWRPNRSAPYCALYVDVRTLPGERPEDVTASLREAVASSGVDATVELFLARPGAEGARTEPLADALRTAHRLVRGGEPPARAETAVVSMWRDTNVFNRAGVPAINFGPGRGRGEVQGTGFLDLDDLIDTCQMYAMAALQIAAGFSREDLVRVAQQAG